MLTKFAVTNYRGFENRIEWDLTKVRNYEFNSFAVTKTAIKNGIIYGPNGCGKSNLGLAIFDIVNHLSKKREKPDYYSNFIFAGDPKGLVKFEYTFQFTNNLVKYIYEKNIRGELKTETLFANDSKIFSRSGTDFYLDTKEFPVEEKMKNDWAVNANNVSIANFLSRTYPLAEDHYLWQLQKFVNSMLWFRCLDERDFIGLETKNENTHRYIAANGLLKDFENFLREVSGQHYKFSLPPAKDGQLFCQVGKTVVPFGLIASTGTNSLTLLYYWLKHIEKEASFVFIDEFDAFYHFKLSREVCRRLFKLNCQAFMTSHNTQLLSNDLLRPDCNFILENNGIRALHDCTEKELREGHNIEKLYRGGTFDR